MNATHPHGLPQKAVVLMDLFYKNTETDVTEPVMG